MKLFTDVRIGKRLAIGFGITLALMAINVIAGIIYFRGVNDRLEYIVTVNNAKILHASNIRASLADVSSLIGDFVTMQDSEVRKEIARKIDESRARYKHAMEELQRLEATDEGKTLIADLKAKVEKGKGENNRVIELVSAGETKEAAEQLVEARKFVEGYTSAADAIVQHNAKRIEFRHAEAQRSASTGLITFVLLGLINIAVGLWLSRSITQSITIPITKSSQHIDLMAKGDFSIPVSEHALKRKDEMGIFAKSMDAMNRNVGKMVGEMKSSAASVASASVQLSASAESLSSGAKGQVDMATQVATASTQMNQATEDIAKNSNQIAGSAGETVKIAKGGQEIVEKAISEVNLIARDRGDRIRVCKTIGPRVGQDREYRHHD